MTDDDRGLFDDDEIGDVHRDGHDTEWDAAESMRGKIAPLERDVLSIFDAHPDGLTDDQGGVLLRPKYPHADRLTWGRRRHDLAKKGLVCDSGKRLPTPRGRNAIVWVKR